MRILIVIDKPGTAIDRLAQLVKKYNPHLNIEILPVHPKENSPFVLSEAGRLIDWADIVDIHYWKSGEVIKGAMPKKFSSKTRILFHFNPYDAANGEVNKQYQLVVVGNSGIQSEVPSSYLVHYGVDLDFFKFNEEYTNEQVVNMSVSRIEGKKGVSEVARACKELGYKFKLVGRVSKPEYMAQVMEAGEGSIEFLENASDEQLRDAYYQSAIHVCNSTDGFESGPLPILESMAVGLPVLTRNVGHVPDLYDGANMVVRQGQPEDIEDLKKNLKEMMENRDWRLKIREKAWGTIKNWNAGRMAARIAKFYTGLYIPNRDLMSVIIPTKDNPEAFVQCLVGALGQDYEKMEVVVADSGDVSVKPIIDEARKKTDVPIKYIHFPNRGEYTLAEARNRGVIEADGEYLVFCDERIQMEKGAVTVFAQHASPKNWFWGVKDGVAKSFVENFSCVNRRDLINGGMFCEEMRWYGGMTQEIRKRFEEGRGFDFTILHEAKARGIMKSKSKRLKKQDIVEAKYLIFKMYEK